MIAKTLQEERRVAYQAEMFFTKMTDVAAKFKQLSVKLDEPDEQGATAAIALCHVNALLAAAECPDDGGARRREGVKLVGGGEGRQD